jgi:hypothetical protein
MNDLQHLHQDKFEIEALGKTYIVYAKDHFSGIKEHSPMYECHGPTFEQVIIMPVDGDNPPHWLIDGKTDNELSRAIGAAIEAHYL